VAWYEQHGFLDGIDLAEVADPVPIDFLAVNYYRRERIAAAPATADWGIGARVLDHFGEHTGNGWEIWPDGLRSVLARIHRDYAPPELAVTENGATFPEVVAPDGSVDDVERRHYLRRHVDALADARDAGVPVRAYFVWSLLDNFEWGEGFAKRFGIVHVDFGSQRRTLKTSGRWFHDLLTASSGR